MIFLAPFSFNRTHWVCTHVVSCMAALTLSITNFPDLFRARLFNQKRISFSLLSLPGKSLKLHLSRSLYFTTWKVHFWTWTGRLVVVAFLHNIPFNVVVVNGVKERSILISPLLVNKTKWVFSWESSSHKYILLCYPKHRDKHHSKVININRIGASLDHTIRRNNSCFCLGGVQTILFSKILIENKSCLFTSKYKHERV